MDLNRQLELEAKVRRTLLPNSVRHDSIYVDVMYDPIEKVGAIIARFDSPTRTPAISPCATSVTDHGIGPALMSTRVSSQVRYFIVEGRPPSGIVQSFNAFICDFFAETSLCLIFVAAGIDLK